MFSRTLRLIRNFKPLLATSILTLGYGLKKVYFDDQPQRNIDKILPPTMRKQKMLKKMIEVEVCESKRIKEGDLFFYDITEQPEDNSVPKTYTVAIGRVKGKLYAVLAHCTYKEPLSDDSVQSNIMKDAMIFNEKLLCPHHGCAFDIRTGSIEYGPARENLPRIYVQQIQNKVRLAYPAVIPISVTPKNQFRDMNDLRKVVVLGGDHNATIGVIDGFKKYDYGGELTIVINDGEFQYPHREDLLHRKLINLNKDYTSWNFWTKKKLDKILEQKLYSELNFYDEVWYQAYGIDFIFNPEIYRIINKRFYPYIKFMEGTKVEFDGLIFATGFLPKLPQITNITTSEQPEETTKLNLPLNVFSPFYNKKEHKRMLRFLNGNKIRKMLVLGMNVQSLQFIEAMNKEFPDVSIKVIDVNKENTMTEIYGPDIGSSIIKEYTNRGVEFYVKMEDIPEFTNRFKYDKAIEESDNVGIDGVRDSIIAKVDQREYLIGDCMVLFPNNTLGNTEAIKSAKYVDIDYNKKNERIIVDTHCRTDTKRMFAAGSCSSLDFFFTRDKLQVINPNVAHEQGMTAAFNTNALNVPFHYIPFETHTFFGKKILYAGARKTFNEMFIMGDVKDWDFIAFYGLDDDLVAVSATPSRQKEFQVIREAFRLQCEPRLPKIVRGQWKIPQIYMLIRKLDKSGCYKDLIETLHPQMNIPDVIWMDRENGSYVTNEEEDDDEKNIEIDSRGYSTQSF